MPSVPDSQPTDLSQRVTTAPPNPITIEIVNDSAPGGIEQNDLSTSRPTEEK